MSIKTQIDRIKTGVQSAYTELGVKGATMPTTLNVDNLASTISNMPTGLTSQVDWNVNDETDPAYVKNRPFYKTDPVETELCNGTYEAFDIMGDGSMYGMEILVDQVFDLSIGQEIKVIWDGTEYNLITYEFDGLLCWGNGAIINDLAGSTFEDSGEPFFVGYDPSGAYFIYTTATGTEHTVEMSTSIVNIFKIEEEYLPDSALNENTVGRSTTGTVYTIDDVEVTAQEGAEIFNNYTSNKASGYHSHAEGGVTTASGDYSHAEGSSTIASGYQSHAEGSSTIASGQSSHAEGGFTTASGAWSHTEGYKTTASANQSHAEGWGTTASGSRSHAEGQYTKAMGLASHAEGYGANTVPADITSSTDNDTIITAWKSTKFNLAKGDYSHTEGRNTLALGSDSHAEGCNTKASGNDSHAEGYNTIASGQASHAEGDNTTASNSYAHAEGTGTTASGNNSHAEGFYTTASGSQSHAEGDRTTASGTSSHAEGLSTNEIPTDITSSTDNDTIITAWKSTKFNLAKGDYSHTEGKDNLALGFGSHAEGNITIASGSYSHAEGSNTTASGTNGAHAEGKNTTASGAISHAEGSGTTASGIASHAEGSDTIASGHYSHAEGSKTTASDQYSHVEGYSTTVAPTDIASSTDNNTIIEAWNSSKFSLATGWGSHSEGRDTLALGDYSHAEGWESIASGYNGAHAEGYKTTASGVYGSHAEGYSTTASGENSHAEGSLTKASGAASHAEGRSATASGNCSHAEGNFTTASGGNSHAEGYSTIAYGQNQHVQGKFNVEDTANTYAHIVGNGTASDALSNAHTLDWSGNAEYQGDVIAYGCGGQTPISLKALYDKVNALVDGNEVEY